jgi:uncharacterized membrane protein YeaQ/YmgE (transglycosylase-associated protein family)
MLALAAITAIARRPRNQSAGRAFRLQAKSAKGVVMSGESLLVILLVGLIAGWLAGQIVRGTGFGLIADIALGIVGALIGIWLLPRLGIHVGRGVIALILAATVGAVLLLLVLGLVNRRGRWR